MRFSVAYIFHHIKILFADLDIKYGGHISAERGEFYDKEICKDVLNNAINYYIEIEEVYAEVISIIL